MYEKNNNVLIDNKIEENRCIICNKGGLFNIRCKCTDYVCSKHKFDHNCNYDYKANYRKELEKKNPKVIADKINKI